MHRAWLTTRSEGDASHYRWQWNKTIGPLKDRPGRPGTWGYQNTDGLGLMEYMNVRSTQAPAAWHIAPILVHRIELMDLVVR